MKYLKSIFFALAVFLYFSPLSFAGFSPAGYEVYTLTWVVAGAEASTRNGDTQETLLAMIDPVNGEVTTIGKTGFGHCTALDFNPAGDLFATCQRLEEPHEPVLVKLDPNTGTGTEVDLTGITEQISDITNTGEYTILAYEEFETSHKVHAIDDMTAASVILGQPGIEGIGNALFSWGDEAIKLVTWVDGANQVYELDKNDAEPHFITGLQVFDDTKGLMVPVEAEPCVVYAADGIRLVQAGGMLGSNSSDESTTTKGALIGYEAAALFDMSVVGMADSATSFDAASAYGLGFIDLGTGIAVIKTRIYGVGRVDGLAIRIRQIALTQVPTLSEWGLIIMTGLLGVFGLLAVRRRRLTV